MTGHMRAFSEILSLSEREPLVQDPKPVVLVLDDDVMALELYSRELGGDYQVITCQSLEDAHHSMQTHRFDAFIIEPLTNGEDGWDLLHEIHTTPYPPALILCSVIDDRKLGLDQGADAFVVKPVLPTTLHRLIDQIVTKRNSYQTSKNG